MNIIHKIKNLFSDTSSDTPIQEQKSVNDSNFRAFLGGISSNRSISPAQSYTSNSFVYACVRMIAAGCAGVPWKLTTLSGDIREDALKSHPLMKLMSRPNPRQGHSRLIEDLISYYLLFGDAYMLRVGSDDLRRPPQELYVLPSNQITPENDGQQITGYRYSSNKYSKVFQPQEILQLTSFNPNDYYLGLSPISPGNTAITLNNDATTWNKNLLKNGGKIPFALNTKRNLTDAEYERLKQAIIAQYTGTDNAGKPMLLEGDMSLTTIGLTPDDVSWTQGQQETAKEIAIVFGIPTTLIGDSAASTLANFEQSRKMLYQDCILPKLDYLRSELNNWLVPLFGNNLYLDYDSNCIEALQENRNELSSRVISLYDSGLITLNEARAQLSLPADTNGDKYATDTAVQSPLDTSKQSKALDNPHLETKALPPMTPEEISMQKIMSGFFAEQLDEGLNRIGD